MLVESHVLVYGTQLRESREAFLSKPENLYKLPSKGVGRRADTVYDRQIAADIFSNGSRMKEGPPRAAARSLGIPRTAYRAKLGWLHRATAQFCHRTTALPRVLQHYRGALRAHWNPEGPTAALNG